VDDLKQAYETLGLSENAEKSEVEKRYFLLVRQARARQLRGTEEERRAAEAELEAVNRAYRTIVASAERAEQEELRKSYYGKYKKWSSVVEKIDHFLHYYKYYLLGAAALVLLVGFGVKTYLDRQAEREALAKLPPADLTVSFFGEFYADSGVPSDPKPVEDALLARFPEWKRIAVTVTFVPGEPKTEFDVALLQKSVIALMTEKPDLYIVDRVNFEKLARQGAFRPLDDEIAGRLKPLLPPGVALSETAEGESAPRVYGIDLTGTSLGNVVPLRGKEMIAAVRADARHPDNAVRLIERFLESR